jgi:hypothetical protein
MHARQTDSALIMNLAYFTEQVALTSHGIAAQIIVSMVRESLILNPLYSSLCHG